MPALVAALLASVAVVTADSLIPPATPELLPVVVSYTFPFSGNLSIDQEGGRVLILVYSPAELKREAAKEVQLMPFPPVVAKIDSVWTERLNQPVTVLTLLYQNDSDTLDEFRVKAGATVAIIRNGQRLASHTGLTLPVQSAPGHRALSFAIFSTLDDFLDTDQVYLEFPL